MTVHVIVTLVVGSFLTVQGERARDGHCESSRKLNIGLMNAALTSVGIERYDLMRLFWMPFFQTAKGNFKPDKVMKVPGEEPFTQPEVVWERGGEISKEPKVEAMPYDSKKVAPRYIVLESESGPFEKRLLEYFGHPDANASHVFFAFQGMRVRDVSSSTTISDFNHMVSKSALKEHDYFPGSTHEGAAIIFEALRPTIEEHLKKRVLHQAREGRNVHVVFAGYSFGGCSAALAAAFLQKLLDQSENSHLSGLISGTLITFGTPRFGDKAFGAYLKKSLSLINFVNRGRFGSSVEGEDENSDAGYKYDPVPFWPLGNVPNPGSMFAIRKLGPNITTPYLVEVSPEACWLPKFSDPGNPGYPVSHSQFDSGWRFWSQAFDKIIGSSSSHVDGFDCLHRSAAYKGTMEFKLTAQEISDKVNRACAQSQ